MGWKIEPVGWKVEWRDAWMGVYWNPAKIKTDDGFRLVWIDVYLCPIPFLVYRFRLTKKHVLIPFEEAEDG